ncbi:MAG: methylmalonyl Co-A mutase-associated GTPase MeaB [Gemmatimonadales bacterium]|jgi:LAO/AO transport system kinase|nr:MAG: methylmalonyl Co-A mutase-associated GTPase MeaB [Gemmatimonadales bacterium]HSG48975.1 methylmalonyl Co-A mutase-associated GTPase MeaB [Longimicrobiales bacterium]
MEGLSPQLRDLLKRFDQGQKLALARAISIVENERDGFQALLHAVLARGLRSERLGITGPPGAGKSSLVAELANHYRAQGDEVGVVAVDPSSPYSGGALLGDRIRMNDLATDPGIFIRSMATRGSLGGLATTTKEVIDLMDGFGFPRVMVETVGVGQTELEVTSATDTVVVVLVPESGDGVQAMKAGLMEIADVFVVNKADRPGADRLLKELRMAIHLRAGEAMKDIPAHHGVDMGAAVREGAPGKKPRRWEKPEGWQIPVLATEAHSGKGVTELADAVEAHRAHLLASGELEVRRRKRAEIRVRDVVSRELRRVAWRAVAGEELARGLDRITEGAATPYSLAQRFVEGILGGGGPKRGTP